MLGAGDFEKSHQYHSRRFIRRCTFVKIVAESTQSGRAASRMAADKVPAQPERHREGCH